MRSTLAPVSPVRSVARSEEQELSVRPAAGPTYLSLDGQRKVGQRKATPRPRPLRIPAQRVRGSPRVFVDSASLHCHEHRRHPCRRPCGLIRGLPPLPRGPFKSAGSCPQELRQEPSREACRDIMCALRPALTRTPLPRGEGLQARFARAIVGIGCHRQPVSAPEPLPRGEGLRSVQRRDRGECRAPVGQGPPYGLLHYPAASWETSATARKRSERRLSRARRLPRTLGSSAITITASKKPSTLGRSWARRISTPT
jgi:hypothetical protein